MKLLNHSLAILAILLFTACASESTETKKETDKTNTNEQAKQLGKETAAPVVNISEFAEMSKADLRLARNTIYAKYGRVFNSKDLKEHFAQQKWYRENPSFKEEEMNKQDLELVKLITKWEEKTSILLNEKADITGNGSYENCFVLYNKNKGTYTVIVNDFFKEFDHYWGQKDDDEGVPSDWAKLNAKIVDIDPEDFKQELHISQRYDDWEDPGTHNVIVAFHKGVQVSELSSTDYDAGILTFNNDGTVTMQQSNCPEHTKVYKLERGKLVQHAENIGPTPPGGCAACFSEDAEVAVSLTQSKKIVALQRGDVILTYNAVTEEFEQTTVGRVLSVYHDNMVRITTATESLTVTDDHPFLTTDGWSSLNPEMTEKRYGYKNVQLLTVESQLIGIKKDGNEIRSISMLNEGMIAYTISTLEKGDNFIVNGCVVGTESMTMVP